MANLFNPSIMLIFVFSGCIDPSSTLQEYCPAQGANLYLKCANGDKKVFGLGYGKYMIKGIDDEGSWSKKEFADFCKDNPKEIYFYFRECKYKIDLQKYSGAITRFPQSSAGNCMKSEANLAESEPKIILLDVRKPSEG